MLRNRQIELARQKYAVARQILPQRFGPHLTVWEVGVGPNPAESHAAPFISDDCYTTLVEPIPTFWSAAAAHYSPSALVLPFAIIPDGPPSLVDMVDTDDGRSYLRGISSPILQNGREHDIHWTTRVPGVPFSYIDPSDIDILLLDMEGAEWYAISTMVSRPHLIFLEWEHTDIYKNPFQSDILAWMKEHHYVQHPTTFGCDTLFVRSH